MEDVADAQAGMAGGVLNAAMEGGPTIGFALLVSLAGAQTTALAAQGTRPLAAAAEGYGFAFSTAAIGYALAIILP